MKVAVIIIVILTIAAGAARGALKPESSLLSIDRLLHTELRTAEYINSDQVQIAWIKQKLDNFNETDNRTWNMRYMANDEFYQPGGPVFIFVGAEWTITPDYITGGHLHDMAREHHAYLFYTEHRYYGESKPTSDISNENIEYLNLNQSLADLAHFVRTMKATTPGMANSKVILAGGSFAGSMVTFFRRLYPELATGCWASSAIVLGKVDFHEYKEIVSESIRQLGGDSCYQRLDNAIAGLNDMFNNQRGEEVKTLLKLCSNFNASNNLDISYLFEQISIVVSSFVQYHNDGDIQKFCKLVMIGDDDINGFTSIWRALVTENCTDMTYKSNIFEFECNPAYTSSVKRQWLYHNCNEFGWFKNSGSGKHFFGTKFPLDLYYQVCSDCFGAKYNEAFIHQQVDTCNEFYGGLDTNVTNVFFTHGSLDPWKAVGIQDERFATIISNYSHVKDFGSIAPKDSQEMRAAKEEIAQLVREWLGVEDK